MAIKDLIKIIKTKNIADDMDEPELMKIGRDVIEGFGKDWDSMADWREFVEAGLKLVKPASATRSTPWEGAANFKTPLIIEARQKFGDRASQELVGSSDIVKMVPIGKSTPDIEKRIERVQAVMNWQLTTESKGWLEQHDKMIYDLSVQGNIFKKTYFSQQHGYNISEVIKYPNFAIHQDTTCFEEAERFTHIQFFYTRNIDGFVNLGIWRDVDLKIPDDKDVCEFYEQQTWLDLDEDGVSEPYLITVHKDSGNVMRIKANFRLDNITVVDGEGETFNLSDLIVQDENGFVLDKKGNVQFSEDKLKVVNITRENCVTNYQFIKDPGGKFLCVGYFHLLGSICEGINTVSNQLLDAGTMANLQGGWLAKGFRKRLGDIRIAPATFHQTDLSAQDLQQGLRLFDLKEPSPTLFNLNVQLNEQGRGLASMLDLGDALGQNTPATTALSIIQEAQEATGAIILRIYRAMGHEFSIWYRLNARYINPKQYKALVNDDNADAFKDFNVSDLDVMPAANPKTSSKIQRMQLAQAQVSLIQEIASTGGNPQVVVKSYLESIGSTDIDQIYPELTPEQEQAMMVEQERQKQLQEAEFQINLKATNDIGEAQIQTARARVIEAQTKQHLAAIEVMNKAADVEGKEAETEHTKAKTLLTIEQAETEATKNAVSIVNAEMSIGKNGVVVEDDEMRKAQIRKLNAEAQAQELENDLVESGMIDLLR